jgi:hypothetical protein
MYSCSANHTTVISIWCDLDPGGPTATETAAQEANPMSPRLLRLDAPRIDAFVFRADSVRFEACATYRATLFPGDGDGELCECGWLEADHTALVSRRQFAGRRPRRRPATVAERETA